MNANTISQTPFVVEKMPPFAQQAIHFLDGQPVLVAVIIAMIVDVLVGICRAVVTQRLSSTVSWRGMSRKVIMLLLIGLAAVFEPFAGGLPLSKTVALFYLVTECLSILENAAASGVPLPQALINALAKLREDGNQKSMSGTASDLGIKLPPGSHLEGKLDIPPTPPNTTVVK